MCNRFNRRGINRKGSVYTCECCGKRTRETGNEESTRSLCLACDLAGEIENMMSDYSSKFTMDEVEQIGGELAAANYDTKEADTKAIVRLHAKVAGIAYADMC